MLGNEADALDATQDALVSAIRALSRFDGRSSFGTWIYRIATNTCIDEMRRRRRRPVTGLAADIAEVADDISSGAPGLFIIPTRRSGNPEGTSEDTRHSRHDTDPVPDTGGPVSVRPGGRPPGAGGRGGSRALTDIEGAGGGRDPADLAAARVDIDAALATLPVEFRTAVVLRDVCDLPYEDIAEILGVPVGTVRSRIARARSALATAWDTGHGATSEGAARKPTGNPPDPPDVRTGGSQPTPATVVSRPPEPTQRGQRRLARRRPDPTPGRSQEEERTP